MRRLSPRPNVVPRLAAAAGLSAVALLTALVIPSGGFTGLADGAGADGGGADGYAKRRRGGRREEDVGGRGVGTIFRADGTHTHPNALADDGHSHSHNDPATKNAVSRATLATDARPPTRRPPPRPGSLSGPRPISATSRSRRSRTCRSAHRTPPRRPTATTCSTPATGCSPPAPAAGSPTTTCRPSPPPPRVRARRSTSSRPRSAATCSSAPTGPTSTVAAPRHVRRLAEPDQ